MRVQTINLNLVPEGISPILHLSQYDKENDGSVIYMIYDGTIPADLTGCTAIIQGTKPDGTAFSYPCSVYTNYVTSAIYSQMTSVAGIYDAEIIITNGEESVGTLNLQISVEKAGVSQIDVSNTDVPTLLDEIQASVDEAEYWAHQAEGAVAGVSKFNGRSGSVMPMAGDYSASMIELENGDNVEERFDNLPDNTTIHYNADGKLEVIGGGGGSGGSTVVVTTSEASLYGATASLSDGEGTPFTAVIDNTGKATFTGVTYTGTVVISASDGSQTAYKDLTIPYFGNYETTLRFWAAPITITTADAEIQDAAITIKKDGVVVGTAQFSSGTATYTAGMTGSYVFSVVYEGTTFNSAPLAVSAETSYSTTIEIWSATVNISTTTPDFYGATVTATLDGASIGSVGTFSNSGALTYIATVAGTYVFTVTSGGETYSSASISVSAETTYTASINQMNVILSTDCSALEGLTVTATNGVDTETATITNGTAELLLDAGDWEVAGIPLTIVAGTQYTEQLVNFAYHYSETDSDPDSGDYPAGYDNEGWTPFAMDLSTGVPDYGSWNPEGTNASKLAWFYPKSCMLKYDGTVDYYLDEDDEAKKTDGTASDVADTSYGGNAMVEWGQDGKRIYWTIVPDTNSDGFTFIVGNNNVNSAMKPWNHYDANDNVNKHFYMAKYFGSLVSGKLRSISGQSNSVSTTREQEITYATANNPSTDVLWYTEVYADWIFQTMMCCLLSKSTNSQAKFGSGRCASGNTGAIGQGTMNGKGMFYGVSDQTSGVKVFSRENPWGNIWRAIAGSLLVSGTKEVKLTYGTADGSSTSGYNTTGSGYITQGGISGTNGGYINKMQIIDNIITPSVMGGSETTYYTDGAGYNNSGTMYAFVGSDWSHAGQAGAFCYFLGSRVSYASSGVGTALSCKPLAE